MNIRCFSNNQDVFLSLECVSGFSFKHALLEDRSVLLPVNCAKYSLQRDSHAHKTVLNTLHLSMQRPD